ncbi:hypothetical protein MMC22_009383 [Lobaria immixta]|nr:hypothetical protein [Lobaria immixta]
MPVFARQDTSLVELMESKLVKYLASGQYVEWNMVFNIAEGMHGLCREAQVPSLLEAYEIPFTFSDAATTALCFDKGRTKVDIQAPKWMGFQDKLTDVFDEKTISQVGALYHGQDILLETFLSGRKITVGILGTGEDSRVIGAKEYVYKKPKPSKGDVDPVLVGFATASIKSCDMDKNLHMDTVSADLSDPEVHGACQLALAAWKVLHCRDAGRIDTRYNKVEKGSVPHIMEVRDSVFHTLAMPSILFLFPASLPVFGARLKGAISQVNPIPGMVPDWSDLALIARDNGLPSEVFLRQIVESALARTRNGVESQAAKSKNNESTG